MFNIPDAKDVENKWNSWWELLFMKKYPIGYSIVFILVIMIIYLFYENNRLWSILEFVDINNIERLEKKVDKLLKYSPRFISEKTTNEVISNLNHLPNKIPVEIITTSGESYNFGLQIKNIFEKANWRVEKIYEALFTSPSELKLGVVFEDSENNEFQNAISPIFDEFGYPYHKNSEMQNFVATTPSKDKIIIVVGTI